MEEKKYVSNIDEIRDAAKRNFSDVLSDLKIDVRRRFCLCPAHNDHTPSCQVNLSGRFEGSIHCYACGYTADAIKLVNDLVFNGVGEFIDIIKYLAPIIGVKIIYSDGSDIEFTPNKKIRSRKENLKHLYAQEIEQEDLRKYKWNDYTSFYEKAHNALNLNEFAINYLNGRGFTKETINRFKLGYYKKRGTPRIVVPISRYYFLGRDFRPNLTEFQKRYSKIKTPQAYPQIYNIRGLYSENPVFIVEGEFDAISIMQLGFEAVAIGGVGGYRRLIKSLIRLNKRPQLIIGLDADDAGRKASQTIKDELETLELYKFGETAFICNQDTKEFKDDLYFGCKDANEALVKNSDELKKRLNMATNAALKSLKSA